MRAGLLAVLLLCGESAGADPLEPLLARAAHGDLLTLRRAHPAASRSDGRLCLLARLAPGRRVNLDGFQHGARAGHVVPLLVAPDRLRELGRVDGVQLVEACRALYPGLDRSVPDTGAITAREQWGLDGRGVVVGIVDSGLDFRHADFLDGHGRTRLLYLMDFSLPEVTVQGVQTHGARVFTAAEIDRQLALDRALGARAPRLVPHRDSYGHGTHVAGIAAGSGAAASPGYPRFRYTGVAPAASLIAVKATRGEGDVFSDADVVRGIQFVFERAAALGLPAVVNISLGTQLGPHDGTSNLASAISALAGEHTPGRAIVCAAGNDGGRDLHAAGFPAQDGATDVVLEIPPYQPSAGRDLVHLEVWYPAGGLSLELTTPTGRALGPVPTGGQLEELTPDGLVQLLNAPDGPYIPNGRYKAVVIVDERDQTTPRPGRWVLTPRGQTPRFDVWLVNPGPGARLLGPVEPDMKIGSPGTARSVITVGAHSLRGSWDSVGGQMLVGSVQPGEHAFFSGTGPALDGRFLPDVSAPGEFVISALSRDAWPPNADSIFHTDEIPDALWYVDRTRALLRGTSQAAPHVTGAVALLLQHRPDLTTAQLRELLRAGARADAHTGWGQAWSPRWGFGKLDVARSLAVLDDVTPGALDPKTSGVAASHDLVPPGSGDPVLLTVIPRDHAGLPLGPGHTVLITASAGRVGPVRHVAFGRHEARFFPEGQPGQVARIGVQVDGVPLQQVVSIFLVARREQIGAVEQGCSMIPGSGSNGLLPWLALLLCWCLYICRKRQ